MNLKEGDPYDNGIREPSPRLYLLILKKNIAEKIYACIFVIQVARSIPFSSTTNRLQGMRFISSP